MKNPWTSKQFGHTAITVDVDDRLRQIRNSNNVEWLKAVVGHPHNQRRVTDAANGRLQKLVKNS